MIMEEYLVVIQNHDGSNTFYFNFNNYAHVERLIEYMILGSNDLTFRVVRTVKEAMPNE